MPSLGTFCQASVIVNTYNYGQFFKEAIETALAQTHSSTELIDDGQRPNCRRSLHSTAIGSSQC
jgi:hypothetical protein